MYPTLYKLMDLEPPPDEPAGTGQSEEWDDVEEKLQLRLPGDYKEYICTYGGGAWASFFGILSPFYHWKHPKAVNFYDWVGNRLSGLDEMHQRFPQCAPPFYRYPSPGGLLPIGYTENGGTICWQCGGEPDDWPIVCFAGKYSLGYDRWNISITGFLVGLLEESLFPKTFPTDFFPIGKPAFKPYREE